MKKERTGRGPGRTLRWGISTPQGTPEVETLGRNGL